MSHMTPIVSPLRKRVLSSQSRCRSCDGLVSLLLERTCSCQTSRRGGMAAGQCLCLGDPRCFHLQGAVEMAWGFAMKVRQNSPFVPQTEHKRFVLIKIRRLPPSRVPAGKLGRAQADKRVAPQRAPLTFRRLPRILHVTEHNACSLSFAPLTSDATIAVPSYAPTCYRLHYLAFRSDLKVPLP